MTGVVGLWYGWGIERPLTLTRYCERRQTGIDSSLDDALFGGADAVIHHLRDSDPAYDLMIGYRRFEVDYSELSERFLELDNESRVLFEHLRRHRFFWRMTRLNITGERRIIDSFDETPKSSGGWLDRNNGERCRVSYNNRRARKAGLEGSLTEEQWLKILWSFNRRCAYCGRERYVALEHITPISLGGPTNRFNVAPACHGCNSSKSGRDPVEFMGIEKFEGIMGQLREIAK